MTWEMIKISFISNKEQLLLVLVICFIIGFVIAMMTSGYNKEKKKKGFKEGRLYGRSKEIDRQMYNDFKDKSESHYLEDSTEHHANKKFQ